MRPLGWNPAGFHNTPALVFADGLEFLHLWFRRWRRLFLCFIPTEQASSLRLGGSTELFGEPERRDRAELLYAIQEKWECGFIRPDRSDKTVKFEVRNVRDLAEKVLPHFRAYPLMSSKQADFERFDRICELVSEDKHLELEGFEEIVRLAMEMNPSGKRKYIGSEILNSLRSGERIVCATGNCGST